MVLNSSKLKVINTMVFQKHFQFYYIFHFILSAFIKSFHKFIGEGEGVQEQGKSERYILYMYASVSLWVIFFVLSFLVFLFCFYK